MANADSVGNGRRVFRIGHRGASGHAPENTIAAIREGISLQVDFVELDVRRTCDGRLVVMHDETVDRTTDCTGLVSAMTWDEMRLLNAGGGRGVPCVQAALAEANGLVGVMLEIKAAGIAADVCKAVRAADFLGPMIYASFLVAEILAIRVIDPLARTMVLVEGALHPGLGFALERTAQMVGLDHKLASAEVVTELHEAELEVWMFTVNEPAAIRRAIDLGADGIISDYPELVPKVRS